MPRYDEFDLDLQSLSVADFNNTTSDYTASGCGMPTQCQCGGGSGSNGGVCSPY